MLTGLRAGDAPLIQRLCGGDMRRFLRVGQLLQQRIAWTEPALGAVMADAGGAAALLDPGFADDPAGVLVRHAEGLGLRVAEPPDCPDGWRVVALADEIGNPLLAALAPAPAPALAGFDDLAPALREPVLGLAEARGADQRAAALERLRYCGAPLSVVARLMPLLLADGAESVRERAIALCTASGARAATVDAVRAVARGDATALLRALDGLAQDGDQADLVVSAIQTQLGRGAGFPELVPALGRFADHLAGHPDLDRILDLLLGMPWSLVDLVRPLQERAALRVHRALHRQLGRSPTQDARLIVLLAGPAGAADDRDDCLERGLDLLLARGDEPRERMPLAAALARIAPGPELGRRLAVHADAIPESGDTAVHWLIADRLRAGQVERGDADRLGEAMRRCLGRPGLHRLAILEQQAPALLPAGPVRAALAAPLLEAVAGSRDERTRDLVVANLVGMGDDAAAALWALLADHPAEEVRLVAAETLPELVTAVDAIAAAGRLLNRLDAVGDGRERAALCTAAARIALGVDDGGLLSRIAAAAGSLGWRAAPAWGWCAAAPACPEDIRGDLVARLLMLLEAEPPAADAGTTLDPTTGETAWILDERLAEHTECVPPAVEALVRALAAPSTGHALRNDAVDRLRRLWRAVGSFATIWGPAAVIGLGLGLARLAGTAHLPAALRLRLLDALLPRLDQPGLAAAVVAAAMVPGGPYLEQACGRVAATLVRLVGDGHFVDEDWPVVLPLLADLLLHPALGPEGDALRGRIAWTIAAHRDRLDPRTRRRLHDAVIDPTLRARLGDC